MENLKFNVGDNVKIVSNDLQPAMVENWSSKESVSVIF